MAKKEIIHTTQKAIHKKMRIIKCGMSNNHLISHNPLDKGSVISPFKTTGYVFVIACLLSTVS
jgi:hypothetical protein